MPWRPTSPRYFDRAGEPFRAPIEGASFHAIPLRADDESTSYGLLLISATGPEIHPDVAWVGRILSRQVSRLMSRQTLAETRFGQERMLLYSIINAVTDPILLTDTEGSYHREQRTPRSCLRRPKRRAKGGGARWG